MEDNFYYKDLNRMLKLAGLLCEADVDDLKSMSIEQHTTNNFRIFGADLEDLNDTVEKLNAKAGRELIQIVNLKKRLGWLGKYDNREKLMEPIYEIELKSIKDLIPGFTFQACVDHAMGNIITRAPDSTLSDDQIEKLHDAEHTTCDVCHTKRFRNQTYIMTDSDNKMVQIGSNCIQRLQGGVTPAIAKQLISFLQWLEERSLHIGGAGGGGDDDDRGGYTSRGHSVDSFLVMCCAAIRQYGFAKMTEKYPTAIIAMNPPKGFKVTQEDGDKADAILNFLQNMKNVNNEFSRTLQQLAMHSTSPIKKYAGQVAYMPVFYDKEQAKMAQQGKPKSASYVGKVGEKIPPTDVEVVYTQNKYGDYGTYVVTIMVDGDGNKFIWYNTSSSVDLKKGHKYKITGTVKKHSEYNGELSTQLTRVKASPVLESVNLSSIIAKIIK